VTPLFYKSLLGENKVKTKVAVALFSLLLCFGTALIGGVRSSESYSTTFPLTQNPINEASHWVNGKSTGIEWANVSTTPGKAIGHEGTVLYSDATALLQNGLSWEPDQTVQATVFQLPGTGQPNCYQEVELRLRSHISPYSITGYEINYKVSNESYAYFGVARWNGALGNFTPLFSKHGSQYGVQNGDVIMAKVIGQLT
jgi:hypothetical protein